MNTQITEDYVGFEVAKLLKERGFDDEYTNAFYDKKGNIYFIDLLSDLSNHPDNDTDIAASTLYVAMKWLRKVHNIFIQVDYIWSTKELYTYTFDIYNMKRARSIFSTSYGESFDSYEEACEEAIKYCLTNLI